MTFDAGIICEPTQFLSDKAVQLFEYLSRGHNAFAALTECRTTEAKDIVCFTVNPELSQLRINDIRNSESIAVHFDKQDEISPAVYVVREDFPRNVPHLNLVEAGWPASLCLYSEPYRDLKPFWTSARFVERIREWLQETSSGTLHAEDQPLEPLFFGYGQHIILPQELYDAASEGVAIKRLALIEAGDAFHAIHLEKLPEGYKLKNGKYPPTAFCIKLPTQEHGSISHNPHNLSDISKFMANAGYDLFDDFYQSIKSGSLAIDNSVLNSPFCLIAWFPKKRNADSAPETTDVWVFISAKNVGEVLVDIGVYGSYSEFRQSGNATVTSPLIGGRDATKNGENVSILILNPTFTLSADLAAIFNGYEESSTKKITAIGAGALGSNIVLNSIRSGFGKWVIIDDDILLPHNLARHALDGTYLGWSKAVALANAANNSVSDELILEAHKADVMLPPKDIAGNISEHLVSSDIILDMSASVSVARYVAHDIDSAARRISVFLMPLGRDLVILAEDKERSMPLDLLEMLYYREIARNDKLNDHLATAVKTRYANSCRDLSSRISNDYVALYGAIGSRKLNKIVSQAAAVISIYQADDNMQTAAIDVAAERFLSVNVANWTVNICESTIHALSDARNKKLPKETGGILIGSFNTQHRKIYITDIISNISDSLEYPDAFIRGHEGLPERINAIQERTAGNLTYVGEWHSHPDQSKCWPSDDDQKVIQWINDYMSADGLPPVMIIAGDKGQLCLCIEKEAKILEWENGREELAIAV